MKPSNIIISDITKMKDSYCGAGWAASRAYISTQLDTKNLGYGFSFYIIFDRFSSMIGPLAWAGLVAFGAPYQVAMLSMTIFILIGIMVLKYKK